MVCQFCKKVVNAAQHLCTGEADPTGKEQHEAGAKLDSGKNRLELVLGEFSRALWDVGLVGTFGANKYTDCGWLSVPNAIQRYGDAGLRHRLKQCMGETYDKDSNLRHAAHEAWNALARLELMIREDEEDEAMCLASLNDIEEQLRKEEKGDGG